jgi:hypothetical protein
MRASLYVSLVILVLLPVPGPALGQASADPGPTVNPQAAALGTFAARVREYMELRARLTAQLPSLSSNATPEEIDRHQQELAAAIRKARAQSRQGDFFTPAVVPQFRAIIRHDLRSRETRDAMAAMQDVPPTISLRVHESWPRNAPRATVPPRLLNNLYHLPEGLEYRFLGRHLVLLDIEANLIIDYVTNVVPSSIRRR